MDPVVVLHTNLVYVDPKNTGQLLSGAMMTKLQERLIIITFFQWLFLCFVNTIIKICVYVQISTCSILDYLPRAGAQPWHVP